MLTTNQMLKMLCDVKATTDKLGWPNQHITRQIAQIVYRSSDGLVLMVNFPDVNWGGNESYYDDLRICLEQADCQFANQYADEMKKG